jgi:hypothetical protein
VTLVVKIGGVDLGIFIECVVGESVGVFPPKAGTA